MISVCKVCGAEEREDTKAAAEGSVSDTILHLVPITSFGNSLVHGALQELQQDGWIGIIICGMFGEL